MSTFLTRILDVKQGEVVLSKKRRIEAQVAQRVRPLCSLQKAVTASDVLQIVAEVKQASPSKGQIAKDFNPVLQATTYEMAGAAAISVLTDEQFFKGSIRDLNAVAASVSCPVLRKDFIIDEVQIDEAYEEGADAILLIAAALEPMRLRELSAYAHHMGLETLVEIHDVQELESALDARPSVLGINNRDLRTFEVSLDTTLRILEHVKTDVPVISESGIRDGADAKMMADAGASGILVGETLMREASGSAVLRTLRSLQVKRSVGLRR